MYQEKAHCETIRFELHVFDDDTQDWACHSSRDYCYCDNQDDMVPIGINSYRHMNVFFPEERVLYQDVTSNSPPQLPPPPPHPTFLFFHPPLLFIHLPPLLFTNHLLFLRCLFTLKKLRVRAVAFNLECEDLVYWDSLEHSLEGLSSDKPEYLAEQRKWKPVSVGCPHLKFKRIPSSNPNKPGTRFAFTFHRIQECIGASYHPYKELVNANNKRKRTEAALGRAVHKVRRLSGILREDEREYESLQSRLRDCRSRLLESRKDLADAEEEVQNLDGDFCGLQREVSHKEQALFEHLESINGNQQVVLDTPSENGSPVKEEEEEEDSFYSPVPGNARELEAFSSPPELDNFYTSEPIAPPPTSPVYAPY